MRNTIEVSASPDEVWSVLGDLEAVTEWVPGIVSAKVEGSTRTCLAGDGSEIREEISDFSAERRSYRYAHKQTPLPVKSSRGSLSVEPHDRGSLVVWEAEFEALDPAQEPEVTRMLEEAYEQTLESLRRRIE